MRDGRLFRSWQQLIMPSTKLPAPAQLATISEPCDERSPRKGQTALDFVDGDRWRRNRGRLPKHRLEHHWNDQRTGQSGCQLAERSAGHRRGIGSIGWNYRYSGVCAVHDRWRSNNLWRDENEEFAILGLVLDGRNPGPHFTA